jgi:hypothetical protein
MQTTIPLSKKSPTCSLIVIENFYEDPMYVREFALSQEFVSKEYFPGKRSKSFATTELLETIQTYIYPFGGKIINFNLEQSIDNDNGSFQFATSNNSSWIHVDNYDLNANQSWSAIVYLTPDAPVTSGTSFYKFVDGTRCLEDQIIQKNKEKITKYCRDMTKWQTVDSVGNVFNRLIIFNANNFHKSMDYFGVTPEESRLFQVFFFSTEY